MRKRIALVVASALILLAASPPYNLDITHPGDTDIQSAFPSNERTYRDNVNSYINTEHDINTGYHKFQELTTTNKNALVSPPTGMLVYDTTLAALQINTGTPGSPTWTNVIVAGVGTVTSVTVTVPSEFTATGCVITSSGTCAITKANENANLVWAGPTTGGAAAPTFRALVAADLPAITGTLTKGTAATLDPVANSTTQAAAHGLGVVPAFAACALVNKTGELGYSTNDVYPVSSLAGSSSGGVQMQGTAVALDSTNTTILVGANSIPVLRKDTGAIANITLGNWKLVCTPYKIN